MDNNLTESGKKKLRILFLEASAGGGHLSITTSIIKALEHKSPHFEIVRADILPHFMQRFYQLTSRQSVNAWSLLYKATDTQQGEILASKLNHTLHREKINRLILKTQPDLIFSNTYFAMKDIPAIIQKTAKKIPFIVFIPDPFTAHGLYFSEKINLVLVSTLASYQAALSHGLSANQLVITGHPVREEFIKVPKDMQKLKKQLGLEPKLFTILFGGSGHGAEKTLDILLSLGAKPSGALIKQILKSANLDYKTFYKLFKRLLSRKTKNFPLFQAICICGDNTELLNNLKLLNYPNNIKPVIFAHIDDMASLIHASDLIVGKAGPNIIFESIMAGKPFFATHHMKGQEDGNIDFIKYAQIGFAEENPQKAAQMLEIILNDKDLLKKTLPELDLLRNEHRDAAEKIAQQILTLLPPKNNE